MVLLPSEAIREASMWVKKIEALIRKDRELRPVPDGLIDDTNLTL